MSAMQCPDWCNDHFDYSQTTGMAEDDRHQLRMRDELGVSVIISQAVIDPEETPVFYLEVDGQEVTPEEARKIADLLSMAADVLEQICAV